MPRYFFDVHDGLDFNDTVGRKIKDMQGVRAEAMKVASELSASENCYKDGYTIIVEVRDDQRANVLVVRMVCQIDEAARRQLKIAS